MTLENTKKHLNFYNNQHLLNQLRWASKEIFIGNNIFSHKDFYVEDDMNYLPKKMLLKEILNLNETFQKNIIAASIATAHQKDDSFRKITDSCRSKLNGINSKFSSLLILANGSGQLVSYLINNLTNSNIKNINYKIYGVDISQTMSHFGETNFYKNQSPKGKDIVYYPVTADCTSWLALQTAIPELLQNRPVLTISHGGARYFIEDKEQEFLNSFCHYPAGSYLIITEVGIENYELIKKLAVMADTKLNLDVVISPCKSVNNFYDCWNLTYYYFLMQQYEQSAIFCQFIDEFLKNKHIKFIGSNHNHLNQVSLTLLEIAGTRKQPIYSLDIYNTQGKLKHYDN